MRIVTIQDFRQAVIHQDVEDVIFRGEADGSSFDLGFAPEAEFIYHFDIAPDVYFQELPIREVYYEPYRTFLRLSSPTRIQVHSRASAPSKLFVKAK